MPDTGREAGLHPPSAHGAQPADRAGAVPLANPARHTDASAPGETPPRDPAETRANSETWETTPDTPQRAAVRETSHSEHNCDEDIFDAFMESCMGDPHTVPTPAAPRVRPEQRRDHEEGTPLTMSRQAHHQRNYSAMGCTEHATAAGDGHAAASGAADQTPDRRDAPASGARVEAGTNTASDPTGPPPGTAPPWGRGHLDYARLEGDASHPRVQAEQAAAQDLGLWINRLNAEEQLALAVCIRWLLILRSHHLPNGTRIMADITFGHRAGHTPPATMSHPSQWHNVATRLMAHMGAYSLDEMNRLHWQWHQRAAVRNRAAMQQHAIWDIPGSPGYQGHTSGHRRLRSQDFPEPPRQAARRNSPECPLGPLPGMGSPSGTYRTPLQLFAPRSGPGSPQTSGGQGSTPKQRQDTRNPSSSRRRSCTPPPAARRVVFDEDAVRDHGGDPCARRTSCTTDPRCRSKRPRTEQAHIRTILTPTECERLVALHTGPHWAADGASSSSATSLPGSAADPLPGGQHAADTQPRRPAADQRPAQGPGGQPPQQPPPRAGRDDTGPGHGHRPPDQPGRSTTGFPTQAATQPNRQGAEGASQQRDHDASRPGADAEMTETSDPQESGDPLPATTTCSTPQPRQPSTGYVPGGHPGTNPGHPSPTGATPDQDRETMDPPFPRPPQRRSTGPFDDAALRALYGMHATRPSSELVAAHRENLANVDRNRLSAVVPLAHAATTEILLRHLQALVTAGTQILGDLVEAWIWWFTTHQPAQGGVWVPNLGWAHTPIALPTDPRPAPSTGARKKPPLRRDRKPSASQGTKAWRHGKAGQSATGGVTSRT